MDTTDTEETMEQLLQEVARNKEIIRKMKIELAVKTFVVKLLEKQRALQERNKKKPRKTKRYTFPSKKRTVKRFK